MLFTVTHIMFLLLFLILPPVVGGQESPSPARRTDLMKEVRREGNKVIVSKSLADKIRADNNLILSSIAVKGSVDSQGNPNGFQVVQVDKGSLAEKIGVRSKDILKEVNGVRILTADDVNRAYEQFKNDTKFKVKVMRRGVLKTLLYEIR